MSSKPEPADIGANGCPKCGSNEYIPIVYGYPSSEGFKKAQKGEIILAGCCVFGDDPTRRCKKCGNSYS